MREAVRMAERVSYHKTAASSLSRACRPAKGGRVSKMDRGDLGGVSSLTHMTNP